MTSPVPKKPKTVAEMVGMRVTFDAAPKQPTCIECGRPNNAHHLACDTARLLIENANASLDATVYATAAKHWRHIAETHSAEAERLRAENAELRAKYEALRIMLETEEVAALRAQVETLTGLCGEVEQWLGLKVALRPTHVATDAAEREAKKTIRQHFGPWLKRFRALKGKR